ncbi:hypothetical protein PSCICO_17080 [Pseudomonas cichorii]|nr:hypothetical protein PSCICO_17080 [Pseudomonas cichorii]
MKSLRTYFLSKLQARLSDADTHPYVATIADKGGRQVGARLQIRHDTFVTSLMTRTPWQG